MTPSKTLFYFCIAFIVGIFLQSIIKIPQIFLWGFLMLGIFIILISLVIRVNSSSIRGNSLVLGFCVLFLTLGIIRFQITEFNIENNSLKKLNDGQGKITLIGKIIDGPDLRDSFQKIKRVGRQHS